MLTLDDLTSDLVWPQLLRAGSLALRPTRIGLALAMLVLIALIWSAARSLTKQDIANQVSAMGLNIVSASGRMTISERASEWYQVFFAAPWLMVKTHPLVSVVAGVLAMCVWGAFGGAISRSAALDYAMNVSLRWPQALGFGVGRWRSLAGALAIPLLVLWGIALAIGVGVLVLRFPGLNVLAGVFWFLALIAGVIGAVIVLAFIFTQSMLVPTIACEGCDSIESVQRAFSFVWSRPLRLVMYSVLLIVQGAVLAAVVFFVVAFASRLTTEIGMAWGGERGERVLGRVASGLEGTSFPALVGTDLWAFRAIKFWSLVLAAIGASIIISFYWTSATLLYLAMRRVCDGQDMREVWIETLVPGTRAAVAPAVIAQPLTGEDLRDAALADES